MTNLPKPAPGERVVYVIRLRPAAGVDAERALRRALKTLLRRFQLKCLSVREEMHG